MAANRARVGGQGFTAFYWNPLNLGGGLGQPIAFAREVNHISPAPVGPGSVAIQPLDATHPKHIITPNAIGMGTLTCEIYELYGRKIWDKLRGLGQNQNGEPLNDLQAIFARVADLPNNIRMVRVITPPRGVESNFNRRAYTEIYHKCVITNVIDGEQINVGTMEILKQVEIGYTHMTRAQKVNDQ